MKKEILLSSFMLISAFCVAQNVGIGTNFPNEKLHIDSGNIRIGNVALFAPADAHYLKIGDGNFITIGEEVGDDKLTFRAKDFSFMPPVSSSYSGYVGIGTVAPTSQLEIVNDLSSNANTSGLRLTKTGFFGDPSISWNLFTQWDGIFGGGNLYFANGGTNKSKISGIDGSYITLSDSNAKKEITGLSGTNILAQIKMLRPVKYLMKSEAPGSLFHFGFIAQDVEKIYPQVVSNGNGMKMMNYSGLIPIAIEGIKEQQQQIEILQKENADLKVRLERLEKLLLKN